ncbi:hypothetical protein [Streptomyces cyaneofuscatus]|uniref:hypothetical protein n=1 Tax=Streptomyces cyaneofuscatus TaxID=66883 RepID=UPI00364DBCDF
MIWASEDVARDQVRRQAAGMTAQQIARAVDEALVRVRETQDALHSPSQVRRAEFAPDPQELAERWGARLAEWQRVAAHLAATGADTYDGDHDREGSAWEREREGRRAEVLRSHAACAARRREERAGLTSHEVLAQLTERVSLGEGGTLSVAPFVPGHVPGGE